MLNRKKSAFDSKERLRAVGLRPTRQRLALARLIWRGMDRHVTPELLYNEAKQDGIKVALGTIYNTLHQFTEAGLLKELALESGRHYFDTNTSQHHHFYDPENGTLTDIPEGAIANLDMPKIPKGMTVDRIEILIHLLKK